MIRTWPTQISNKQNHADLSPSFLLGGRPWSGALCEVTVFENGPLISIVCPTNLGNVGRENGGCAMISICFLVKIDMCFEPSQFPFLKMGGFGHAHLTVIDIDLQ